MGTSVAASPAEMEGETGHPSLLSLSVSWDGKALATAEPDADIDLQGIGMIAFAVIMIAALVVYWGNRKAKRLLGLIMFAFGLALTPVFYYLIPTGIVYPASVSCTCGFWGSVGALGLLTIMLTGQRRPTADRRQGRDGPKGVRNLGGFFVAFGLYKLIWLIMDLTGATYRFFLSPEGLSGDTALRRFNAYEILQAFNFDPLLPYHKMWFSTPGPLWKVVTAGVGAISVYAGFQLLSFCRRGSLLARIVCLACLASLPAVIYETVHVCGIWRMSLFSSLSRLTILFPLIVQFLYVVCFALFFVYLNRGSVRTALRPRSSPSKDTASSAHRLPAENRLLPIVCVAVLGCAILGAIMAMVMTRDTSPVMVPAAPGPGGVPGTSVVENVMTMKATDGQPLIVLDQTPLVPPNRPGDPSALPKEDPLHWYDREYAGWATAGRAKMPASPGDGPKGKRVVCLRYMDHPYTTAYTRGMQRVADAYGIELKALTAGNADVSIQSRQVDQCVNAKPDLVIIFPVDATAVVPMLRKLNKAGVPVIASNLLPIDEGMKYVLTWTGPDDWGQFRMLARELAKRMNYQGGYTVVQHMRGGSCFFSRTWSVITELKKIAPKMKCLEMDTTDLDAEKSTHLVASWLTKYGKELKGIVSADDSGAQTGINEACKNMNRQDVIRVAAGNSKVGMNFIKAGTLHALTYQSAEADGALPMKIAADWFSGKPIARPVYYLHKQIITKDNVDKFLPVQW